MQCYGHSFAFDHISYSTPHTAHSTHPFLNSSTKQQLAADISVGLDNGTLAVVDVRDVAPLINNLLKLLIKQKRATSDFHPRDHMSFTSQHPGEEPFNSIHTIYNPEAPNKDDATYQIINIWPDRCVGGTRGSDFIPELPGARAAAVKGEEDGCAQRSWRRREASMVEGLTHATEILDSSMAYWH
jgi:nicotinamidase-related amidase